MTRYSPAAEPAPQHLWTVLLSIAALSIVMLVMFLPILAFSGYIELPVDVDASDVGGREVAVGVAVVVRATVRRLLRTGAQTVLRTMFGAFTRTTARTVTRRLTRIFLRQLAALTFAGLVRQRTQDGAVESPRVADSLLAIGVGFVALTLSFWTIANLVGTSRVADVLLDLSPFAAGLLMATPLLLHAMTTYAAARTFGLQVHFNTPLDGLLLQGYFTGAMSFLPLTTDVSYEGSPAARGRTAAAVLLGLLVLHWVFYVIGITYDIYPLTFLAAAIILYGFVFSFPLTPLEGRYVWQHSKALWLAIWLPTLATFVAHLPPTFAEVL